MLENLRLAFRGIWTHKLRSFLTMLGIIIGVIISFVLKIFGDYSLQVAFIIYNTFASFVIIQFAKGIYDKVEI